MMNTQALSLRKRQQGVVTIEFALIFTLFFIVFYMTVSYSLAILVKLGLNHAAAEGVRAAVRLNQLNFASAEFRSGAQTLAVAAVNASLSGLPEKARTKVAEAGGIQITWIPSTQNLPTGSGGNTIPVTTLTMKITLQYQGYAADPLVPTFDLPFLGRVPPLPTNLVGEASIQP
jgi:Flp pilus assembly protein TadG